MHEAARSARTAPEALFLSFRIEAALIAAMLFVSHRVNSEGVVNTCNEASLRSAMNGGGTVTFACDGTITLAGTINVATNTVLDGTGHAVTISGNNAVRIFTVNSNVTFVLNNLVLANGLAAGGTNSFDQHEGTGGGVCNTGTLQIVQCTFTNNEALGVLPRSYVNGEAGRGGANFNVGTLSISSSTVVSNRAVGSAGGSEAAFGGSGLPGGLGHGAGIYNGGIATIASCVLRGNVASGGNGGVGQAQINNGGGPAGGPGGPAWGAGLHNDGSVSISTSTFANNLAIGGDAGAPGAPGYSQYGIYTGAKGGDGGPAGGAGLYSNGSLVMTGCTISSNSAFGGKAGAGGDGNSGFSAGNGGAGGTGGYAQGGAISSVGGTLALTNCTLAANSVKSGGGGNGGNGGATPEGQPSAGGNGGNGGDGGGGPGGGISSTNPSVQLADCTISGHVVQAGAGGPAGNASCGYRGGCGVAGAGGSNGTASGASIRRTGLAGSGFHAVNSIVAGGIGAANCSGGIIDDGFNLCSDNSAAFSKPSSLNNTDPKLALLAANGGATMTLALLPDSPAIDSGPLLAGANSDQRGVPRPYGAAADIGAYEWNATSFYTSFRLWPPPALSNGFWYVHLIGPTGVVVRFQRSADLSNWQNFATNASGPERFTTVQDPTAPATRRFYRSVSP